MEGNWMYTLISEYRDDNEGLNPSEYYRDHWMGYCSEVDESMSDEELEVLEKKYLKVFLSQVGD